MHFFKSTVSDARSRQHTVIPGSTFEDQLCWLCICSRRASVMEQTTSNNPVIWHSSEFQDL